jgi:hypothetical protein
LLRGVYDISGSPSTGALVALVAALAGRRTVYPDRCAEEAGDFWALLLHASNTWSYLYVE